MQAFLSNHLTKNSNNKYCYNLDCLESNLLKSFLLEPIQIVLQYGANVMKHFTGVIYLLGAQL
jgi:hypothetical protein